MDKQEIIDTLVNKENFDKVVDICINHDLYIPSKGFPNIYIYHETSHLLNSTYLNDYVQIIITDPKLSFVVDGEIKTGVDNFFKYYEHISEFIWEKYLFRVVPNIIPNHQHWYKTTDNEDNEIGYKCHSLNKPAIESPKGYFYFIDGREIEYKDWLKLNRMEKLSNILEK